MVALRQERRLVDVPTDGMAEPVAEIRPIARVLDHGPRDGVDRGAGDPVGQERLDPGLLAVHDEAVSSTCSSSGAPKLNGAAEVAAHAVMRRDKVEEDRHWRRQHARPALEPPPE